MSLGEYYGDEIFKLYFRRRHASIFIMKISQPSKTHQLKKEKNAIIKIKICEYLQTKYLTVAKIVNKEESHSKEKRYNNAICSNNLLG